MGSITTVGFTFTCTPIQLSIQALLPIVSSMLKERSSTVRNRSIQWKSKKCIHTQLEDRCFRGTLTSSEVKVALESGYRTVDVAEVWSWSRSKRSASLFKNYINQFLKIKAEASGWPQSFCSSPPDKESELEILFGHKPGYLKDLQKKEGIILDPLKVAKNEG